MRGCRRRGPRRGDHRGQSDSPPRRHREAPASADAKETMSLEDLYQQIPVFQCLPGCTACCGPVPFTKEEWERVEDKRTTSGLTCPYANEAGCAIYENRPFMCRLFGTTESLRCPLGCGPIVLLTADEARKLSQEYIQMCRPGPLPTHPALTNPIGRKTKP